MTAYIPALIWLISAIACIGIAKRRNVEPTAARKIVVTLLGPIAIPMVLLAQPMKCNRA